MITEEIQVEVDTTAANTQLRQFQSTYDDVMNHARTAAERATAGAAKLAQQQEKTTNTVHQLRMGMFQLGSALAVTGGRTGILINAFAEMGAMMLSGGVLGVGIGLIVAGFTAWNLLMKDTESSAAKVADLMRDQAAEARALRAELLLLQNQVEDKTVAFFLGQRASSEFQLRREITRLEEELPGARMEHAMSMLGEGGPGINELTEEEVKAAQIAEERLRLLEGSLAARRQELLVVQEQNRIEDKKERGQYYVRPPPEAPMRLNDVDYGSDQYRFGGAADKQAGDAAAKRAAIILDLENRIAEGKLEIAQSNAERIGEIEQHSLDRSMARYDHWAGRVRQSFNIVTDAALSGLEAMIEGEEYAAEQMAVDVLKGIGKQLIGMGIQDVYEGGRRIWKSYGADATGEALLAQGIAEMAAGATLMAGGLAGQNAINTAKADSSSASFSGYGAGGSSFGDSPQAQERTGTVVIQVVGALTVEEQSALVARGIDEARERGLI